jgi:hypothetical protein
MVNVRSSRISCDSGKLRLAVLTEDRFNYFCKDYKKQLYTSIRWFEKTDDAGVMSRFKPQIQPGDAQCSDRSCLKGIDCMCEPKEAVTFGAWFPAIFAEVCPTVKGMAAF